MSCEFIISLDNVDVKIHGRTVLSGITWKLRQGEHWAFIGGNGAGKSTLLKLIRGELWPVAGGQGTRHYCFGGKPHESAIGVKKRIAIVSSELHDNYHRYQWNMTGRDVVYTGFFDSAWLHQEPTVEQQAAAEQIVQTLKLENLLGKNFLEMSEGEARKILIARALAVRPAILALDEPCNGLDYSSKKKLLHLIDKVAEAGTILLYATHRVKELVPSITHALVLDHGKIIDQGEKNSIMQHRAGTGSPVPEVSGSRTCLKSRSIRCNGKQDFLIEIKHADVFIRHKKILSDICWGIRRGEHWAIVGSNGAGKTTLLKLIAGDIYPALGGEVQRFGGDDGGSIWDLRKRIGVVSPELQRGYAFDIKVNDAVLSGFFSSIGLYDEATDSQKEAARHWIDFFELRALSERQLSELSYGEQRKILIARAMVNSPDILILDEPYSGLDSASRAGFHSFISQAARKGVALIMTTHHPDEIPPPVTHIMLMDKGKIIAQGTTEEMSGHMPGQIP